MTREKIYEDLTQIFHDVFDDEDIVLSDGLTADDIDDWDSLEQINLLVAMEKHFNVKFQLAQVSGLSNVGEMVDLIEQLV